MKHNEKQQQQRQQPASDVPVLSLAQESEVDATNPLPSMPNPIGNPGHAVLGILEPGFIPTVELGESLTPGDPGSASAVGSLSPSSSLLHQIRTIISVGERMVPSSQLATPSPTAENADDVASSVLMFKASEMEHAEAPLLSPRFTKSDDEFLGASPSRAGGSERRQKTEKPVEERVEVAAFLYPAEQQRAPVTATEKSENLSGNFAESETALPPVEIRSTPEKETEESALSLEMNISAPHSGPPNPSSVQISLPIPLQPALPISAESLEAPLLSKSPFVVASDSPSTPSEPVDGSGIHVPGAASSSSAPELGIPKLSFPEPSAPEIAAQSPEPSNRFGTGSELKPRAHGGFADLVAHVKRVNQPEQVKPVRGWGKLKKNLANLKESAEPVKPVGAKGSPLRPPGRAAEQAGGPFRGLKPNLNVAIPRADSEEDAGKVALLQSGEEETSNESSHKIGGEEATGNPAGLTADSARPDGRSSAPAPSGTGKVKWGALKKTLSSVSETEELMKKLNDPQESSTAKLEKPAPPKFTVPKGSVLLNRTADNKVAITSSRAFARQSMVMCMDPMCNSCPPEMHAQIRRTLMLNQSVKNSAMFSKGGGGGVNKSQMSKVTELLEEGEAEDEERRRMQEEEFRQTKQIYKITVRFKSGTKICFRIPKPSFFYANFWLSLFTLPAVLSPYGFHMKIWSTIFLNASLLALIIDPMFFFTISLNPTYYCFYSKTDVLVNLTYLRAITDAICFVNIIIQFRLAFRATYTDVRAGLVNSWGSPVKLGELVFDESSIIRTYLKRSFTLDVLTTLPVPEVLFWLIFKNDRESEVSGTLNVLCRLACLLQIIPRLIRLYPILSGSVGKSFFETAWGGFLMQTLSLIWGAHVIACIWYLLGAQRASECLKRMCHDEVKLGCKAEFLNCPIPIRNPLHDPNFNLSSIPSLASYTAANISQFYSLPHETSGGWSAWDDRSAGGRGLAGARPASLDKRSKIPLAFSDEINAASKKLEGRGKSFGSGFGKLRKKVNRLLSGGGRRGGTGGRRGERVTGDRWEREEEEGAYSDLDWREHFRVLANGKRRTQNGKNGYSAGTNAPLTKAESQKNLNNFLLTKRTKRENALASLYPPYALYLYRSRWANLSQARNCCINSLNSSNIIGFEYINFGLYASAVPLLTSRDFLLKYLFSLSWSLQQIVTAAGSQIPSYQIGENLFFLIIILMSLFLFALMFAQFYSFLDSLHSRSINHRLWMRDLNHWMDNRDVPAALRKKLRKFERFTFQMSKGVKEEEVLESLTEDIRRDVRSHLCLDLIKKCPLLAVMDGHVQDAFCERVSSRLYLDGTLIVKEGAPVSKMFFIQRGLLEVYHNGVVAYLSNGDFIGEELLIYFIEKFAVKKKKNRRKRIFEFKDDSAINDHANVMRLGRMIKMRKEAQGNGKDGEMGKLGDRKGLFSSTLPPPPVGDGKGGTRKAGGQGEIFSLAPSLTTVNAKPPSPGKGTAVGPSALGDKGKVSGMIAALKVGAAKEGYVGGGEKHEGAVGNKEGEEKGGAGLEDGAGGPELQKKDSMNVAAFSASMKFLGKLKEAKAKSKEDPRERLRRLRSIRQQTALTAATSSSKETTQKADRPDLFPKSQRTITARGPVEGFLLDSTDMVFICTYFIRDMQSDTVILTLDQCSMNRRTSAALTIQAWHRARLRRALNLTIPQMFKAIQKGKLGHLVVKLKNRQLLSEANEANSVGSRSSRHGGADGAGRKGKGGDGSGDSAESPRTPGRGFRSGGGKGGAAKGEGVRAGWLSRKKQQLSATEEGDEEGEETEGGEVGMGAGGEGKGGIARTRSGEQSGKVSLFSKFRIKRTESKEESAMLTSMEEEEEKPGFELKW